MGKVDTARKIASAAVVSGGGISVLGAGLYGVMRAEAVLARKAIGNVSENPPPIASGWYGRRRPGPAIKVALLGDSGAAGYGVDRVEETPGAHLGTGISRYADRRVYLGSFAIVGAQTSDLMDQVDRALPIEPDVAVISIGTNDATHGVTTARSIEHLEPCLRKLREAGVEVVFGTCPDLGTVRPINPPLRQWARMMSRRLAAAQMVAVVEGGGRSVSLADVLGPEFEARPLDLFGPDRFHPSAEGYEHLAGVLLPSALAALGLGPTVDVPVAGRGEGVVPLARAATEAARTSGTELDGTAPRRGVRGRLVELRHRRRQPTIASESPDSELEPA